MKFKSIKGTKDILPGEVEHWQFVENLIHKACQRYGYREIRTPIFEETALFARSIGELTDIVSKEMYTFEDRSGTNVALRPEGTAAVLRAYLQNNFNAQESFSKFYYIGPMFRQERPQAGRLRQFHQFGIEAIGSASPYSDVEILVLPLEIYRELGIKDTILKMNSVGCQNCRPQYKEVLQKELKKIVTRLSPESQARIERNPLRVLDSKNESDQKETNNVPLLKDYLCKDCKEHISEVCQILQNINIPFIQDYRLVRGLDYYTKTAFEITNSSLGSQDALAAGGRYDLLTKELGGQSVPAVGVAAGMERLLLVMKNQNILPSNIQKPDLYIAVADSEARASVFKLAMELRREGIEAEIDYLNRSLKAQMREANKISSTYVVVIGQNELTTNTIRLKSMQLGKEITITLSSLSHYLKQQRG